MMNSQVEEIKARLDIVELISSYVRLQKSGVNYKALCPFHTEKTPSFFVSPSRQIWHCFGGCGKGGDIFKFIMEIEGLEFPEALKLLAQRAGVVLRKENPSLRSERNRLYDLCEEAACIFEDIFTKTSAVKNYLAKRGVSQESVRKFRIGFAPRSWDFLLKTLGAKGFKNEEMEKAGLIIKSTESGSYYDRFRGRIIFPITDANSRVVGFGGRVFESDAKEAKYINTPQTLIYDKSQVLYGFNLAKQVIRSQNQAVIVEGYMDCIMSHQVGIQNAVAVSGTALTPQQLKILKRLTDSLVFAFDADTAGESATKRSLTLAAQFEFNRKIVHMSGKDPADIVLEDADIWRQTVKNAKPVVEFYFEKVLGEETPRSAEEKKAASATLLPFIRELTDEIEKSHWVRVLAEKLKVDETSVWSELKKMDNIVQPQEHQEEWKAKPSPPRRVLLEERFLTLLSLLVSQNREKVLSEWKINFTLPEHQEIFELLKEKLSVSEVKPELREKFELLRFKGEILATITKDLELEFGICRRELEKEYLKEELIRLGGEIERLEKEGKQMDLRPLLENFRELSLRLKQL